MVAKQGATMTNRNHNSFGRLPLIDFGLALALLSTLIAPVRACTIFVLTDSKRVLFCNNEDWTNPKTRIWFVPASRGRYGCAYVGFNDNHAQGGLNTEGLAYDWVAGSEEPWSPEPNLQPIRGNGNSSQQMLETCVTVEDAVAFYHSHQEGSFSRAKILIADRTGASVIIGAQYGRLVVQREDRCRGFGYGERPLDKMLAARPEPTVANGFKILRACLQKDATKYSNIFDLKSGDIFLFPFQDRDDEVKFNLAVELKKSGHYYDLPQIHKQMAQPIRPLPPNMQRVFLEDFKPIPENDPTVTAKVRSILHDAMNASMHEADYTAKFWKEISTDQKNIQAGLKKMGDLGSLTLVDSGDADRQRTYRYRMQFKNATVLQYFVFDEHGKLDSSQSEDTKWNRSVGGKTDWQPPANSAGLGLLLGQEKQNAPLTIQGVIPTSPAEKAGIKPGGLLLSINGADTAGMSLNEIVASIRGEPGTMVKLNIADPVLHQTNTWTLRRQVIQTKIGVSEPAR
jgi:hypothetical protein